MDAKNHVWAVVTGEYFLRFQVGKTGKVLTICATKKEATAFLKLAKPKVGCLKVVKVAICEAY